MHHSPRLVLVVFTAISAGCVGIIGIEDVRPEGSALGNAGGGGGVEEAGIPVDAGPGQTAANEAGPSPTDANIDVVTVNNDKRVFVTSTTHDGNLGGLATADARCAEAAANGKLGGGPWVAWLSTDTAAAATRVTSTGPWVRLDGALVAANKAQLLSGALSNPIAITELNAAPPAPRYVWTGSNASGTYFGGLCYGWANDAPYNFGMVGVDDAKDATWTAAAAGGYPGGASCDTAAHLYCFEQ